MPLAIRAIQIQTTLSFHHIAWLLFKKKQQILVPDLSAGKSVSDLRT